MGTDRPTDRQTYKVTYRSRSTRQKGETRRLPRPIAETRKDERLAVKVRVEESRGDAHKKFQ